MKRILVTDDNDTNRELLKLQVEQGVKGEFEVETASSGDETLEKLSGNFDIAVLDNNMPPGPTGEEIIRRLRNQDYRKSLTLYTSDDHNANAYRRLEKETNSRVFGKPSQKNEMISHVQLELTRLSS